MLWRAGRRAFCLLRLDEALYQELRPLARQGALAALQRRLGGALVAANGSERWRGAIFRCALLAAINADDAEAAARWLKVFSQVLPDASGHMTTLAERGKEELSKERR